MPRPDTPRPDPRAPRRRLNQAVLRPYLAIGLLSVVVATLGAADARAQSFALDASAPTRAAATTALSARAGHECGLTRLNRGWITDHRLEELSCKSENGIERCAARVTCTLPPDRRIALR